jgi:hypothetical protein
MIIRNGKAWLAMAHGCYFFLTGVWPILHLESFIWVTGPKTDLWLVKTVGLLIAVNGAVIGMGGVQRRVTPELKWLAIGSAACLAFIDVYYYLDGTLRWVYLLDAGAEAILIGMWYLVSIQKEREPGR